MAAELSEASFEEGRHFIAARSASTRSGQGPESDERHLFDIGDGCTAAVPCPNASAVECFPIPTVGRRPVVNKRLSADAVAPMMF